MDGEAAFKAVLLLELVNFDKGDLLFGCGVKDSKPDKRGARLVSKQREAVVEEKSAGIGRAALWADLEQARVLWDKVVACVQGCFEVDLPQLGFVFGHAIGDGFVGGQPDACEGCACEEEALLLHCC